MAPGTCSETERDLHLAAQLGRALLERNNELEEVIRVQDLDIDQKKTEIQFLTRHVEMLREDFDSYLSQEEHNSQQLEGKISELEEERKINRENIKRLKRKINELETHSAELEKEVDKFAITQESMTRSKCHCDSLSLTYDSTYDDDEEELQPRLPIGQSTPLMSKEMMNELSAMENQIAHLQSDLDDYKAKYRQERIASETLRRDFEQISLEKSLLEDQLSVLKNKLNSSKSLEAELRKWRQENSSLENKSSLEKECEFEELDIQKGVLIKLGNGVQAYGSEDSFSSEEDFAHLDEDGDDDSSNSRRPSLLEELLHDGHLPPPSLTPPDSPHKNTFAHVFGSVIQPPSSTIAVQTDHCAGDDLAAAEKEEEEEEKEDKFTLEPLTNPFENNFRKTPEYKSLFQEIFMVLKRTVGGNTRSPKKEAIPLSVFGK